MSLEAELFQLINTKKYPEALRFVASIKELNINAVDEEGRSFLVAAIEKFMNTPQERYAFMESVLAHPEFQHANKPKNGSWATPLDKVLIQSDSTAVDLIIKYTDAKNIQVVFNKDKLLYELQVQEIQDTKEQMKIEPSAITSEELDKQQHILDALLNAAVLHAIKTDDPAILQRLAAAGAKLHHPLKDGTYAMDLVRKQTELKVHLWLSSYINQIFSSSPTFTLASHGLARQHEAHEQAIVEQQIEKTSESIKGLFKFFDYQEPSAEEQKKQQATPSPSNNPGNK